MRLWTVIGLTVILSLCATIAMPADQNHIREQIQQKRIVVGQSFKDVRTLIGEPTRITKTQTYWETTELWMYGEGKDAISLTFREGRLKQIGDGHRSTTD
jgi:hypothetical protein